MVNSSMQDDKIILRHGINVGIAVSLGQNGLIVPVIRDAKDKSLFNIASELNDLTTRAREQRLEADEVQDGTFTITNHGVSGSLMATPIINQPQCAIMGVGVIQKRAMVIEDSVVIRPMAYLTLSFDHRIIDGVIADDFLANVKRIIEAWT
jgi:2-oxoglutarate dehydrogenase E2 component (dihydrolipoamide succinyltransferase)